MSEMTMVERVARALARQDIVETENPLLIAEADRRWGEYVFAARAAIEAMREPTEAMAEVGFQEIKPDGLPADRGDAIACFMAMIDSALKE